MTDSRAKGAKGEREFIARHLVARWPEAARNYGQVSGEDKRDCLGVDGLAIQVKRVERLELWPAIAQAQRDAIGADVPVVAFRRNRSSWKVIVDADVFFDLWAAR
jgi:hypothetical protein